MLRQDWLVSRWGRRGRRAQQRVLSALCHCRSARLPPNPIPQGGRTTEWGLGAGWPPPSCPGWVPHTLHLAGVGWRALGAEGLSPVGSANGAPTSPELSLQDGEGNNTDSEGSRRTGRAGALLPLLGQGLGRGSGCPGGPEQPTVLVHVGTLAWPCRRLECRNTKIPVHVAPH